MAFTKQLLLAGALLTPMGGCASSATLAPTPSSVFEEVWSNFDRHYSFFELGHVDWPALGATYRDSVAAAPNEREVARLTGAMIGRLRDYHADLRTPFGTFGAPAIAYPHHFSPDVMRSHYFQRAIQSTPSGKIYFAPLENGIGYVYIGSFVGDGWGADIEDALSRLGDISGLVLDIRDNGGGNEAVGREVAIRFYDRDHVYRLTRFRTGPAHTDFGPTVSTSLSPGGTRRFAKPVALITNRWNGSAGEDFTLMMRPLPNVVVVGDTTLGLGSNPLEQKLSNGWTLRIPQSMQSTPDGFVYQWLGLPPAVPVVWDEAVVSAGRDPYIDAAIGRVSKMIGVARERSDR